MGIVSRISSITSHIALVTLELLPFNDTYVPRNGQNCINSIRSLNLTDVQPIITIIGLKKTGRAYFVTFGALFLT